jgi:hypothetical protein
MYDIKQEQYTTVIREMIRHENDVTNQGIMWLLIGQGFIASALSLRGVMVHPRISCFPLWGF